MDAKNKARFKEALGEVDSPTRTLLLILQDEIRNIPKARSVEPRKPIDLSKIHDEIKKLKEHIAKIDHTIQHELATEESLLMTGRRVDALDERLLDFDSRINLGVDQINETLVEAKVILNKIERATYNAHKAGLTDQVLLHDSKISKLKIP